MIKILKTDRASRDGEDIYELVMKHKENHPIIIDIAMSDIKDVFEYATSIIKEANDVKNNND